MVCFAHFPRVHVPDSDYSDTCNCQGTVGICICSNEYNVKVGVFVHRSCLKKYGTDNFRNGQSVPAAIRCLRERAITMEEFKAARPCKIYCPSSMRQRLCGFSHTRQGDTRTLTSRLVWVWLAVLSGIWKPLLIIAGELSVTARAAITLTEQVSVYDIMTQITSGG